MKYVAPYGSGDPNAPYVNGNPSTGVQGSIPPAAAFEHPLRELVALITAAGLTPTDAVLTQVAQAVQKGLNYAVATGTANAWVVAPNLAVPAYAAGRVLNIIAPATNTSTTVNMNVSTLGNRRIKKSDGSDPAVGDLVSGKVYVTIDDGTNIRVLNFLPSDLAAQKSPFNVKQQSFSTRTSLSGTGFVAYQTGTYTKQSATSNLIVELHAHGYAAGTAASIARVAFGANSLLVPFSNSVSAQTGGGAHATKVFSGIAAGALSWSWDFGRGDATAWTDVINPTSADVSYLPSETTSSLLFMEVEP